MLSNRSTCIMHIYMVYTSYTSSFGQIQEEKESTKHPLDMDFHAELDCFRPL